ncbi:MAG: hypothetical protein KDB60_03790 [Propionibacteriaceae bacterium]|nr:hypothetical protein [Propionibacteriaceae bacterium]
MTEKRGLESPLVKIAAGVLAFLLSTYIALAFGLPGARIEFENANTFIRRYLQTAPQDPGAAYNGMTTAEFQSHVGFSDYADLWGDVEGADDVYVATVADRPDSFRTSWVFVGHDGQRYTYKTQVVLTLQCADRWSRLIVDSRCPVDSLRINSSESETESANPPKEAPEPARDAASDRANVGKAPKRFSLPEGLATAEPLLILRPCAGEPVRALPSLKQRLWSRVGEESGEEHVVQVGAIRFVTEDAATGFMDELKERAQDCEYDEDPATGESRVGSHSFPAGAWDEALMATSENQMADGSLPPDGHWGATFFAARSKDLVAVTWSRGLWYTAASEDSSDPNYLSAVRSIRFILKQR